MLDYAEANRDYVGLPSDNLIGIQQVIKPFHIVKYRLRDGAGGSLQPGMTLCCLLDIHLIDGTQIVSSKGNKVTKLLFGRNRLIKGLEIGLKGTKKNEKLRLIISPDYGYGADTKNSLVPPNSKLIFEIDIIDFARVKLSQMSDIDLYYEVYFLLDESDYLLRKLKEDEGLQKLYLAYCFAKKIKHYKCNLVGRILLRWAYILNYRGENSQALLIINRIDRCGDSFQDCLRLHIKILTELGNKDETQKLVQKTYQDYRHDSNIKRMCIDYFKETKQWDKLKRMDGYDFKKDKFVEPKYYDRDLGMPFRLQF